MLNGLDAVFTPHRIALVGASERAGTVGRLLWHNLQTFPGEVLPISRAPTVCGVTAFPDLLTVPGHIDLAIVAVPAGAVLSVIRDAAASGVGAAVILSAGFAETGAEGAALQRELVEVASAAGLRLVGPNCFGVQNVALSLNASIAPDLPPAPRTGRPGISLVTQSGAYGMAVHSLGCDESIPFAKVFAAGNKADIADHEILAYLADDPATGVICLLLESISQPREFFEHARLATRVKPVIVTLTGRSTAGRRAALSHTGSLATRTFCWTRCCGRPAWCEPAPGCRCSTRRRLSPINRRPPVTGLGSSPIPAAPEWNWRTCWSTRGSPCRSGVPGCGSGCAHCYRSTPAPVIRST